MKIIHIFILLFFALSINAQSFYDLEAKTIEGNVFKFKELKGKKVLIVNTASKCGYTPQYEDLEKLNKKYKKNGLVILGFPSNDFLKQEPGTDKMINQFCTQNYGVSFQMMSKIHVKGKKKHDVYKWLTNKDENKILDSKVKWNFQKYFIDEDGKLVEYFSSRTKPFDERIIKLIEK